MWCADEVQSFLASREDCFVGGVWLGCGVGFLRRSLVLREVPWILGAPDAFLCIGPHEGLILS